MLFAGKDGAANRSRTGNQNAYLVKRRSGGGVMFSRDPMNLTNKHSRTHAGFINEKAVGIQPNDKGGVDLVTKKSMKSYQPGQHHHKVSVGKGTSNQK
jgi:large subunit ribosomal protein L28e